MKYFLDTEFIEGFFTSAFSSKRRHYVDLISIGIVCEDGREYHAISREYRFNEADKWVQDNVIKPLYISTVHGDARNHNTVDNFHYSFGKTNAKIKEEILDFFGCWRDQLFYRATEGIEIYGYYADYDWVLFCSLFGRMIDLPKGFPMYCRDLKQMMDEKGLDKEWKQKNCPDPEGEHNALVDAKWNLKLFQLLTQESNVSSQEPDAEQMKTDKGVVLAHYYQVEPDSHYWTSLEMLLNYLKQVEIFTGYRSYLIKGIENTIKNGFRLINTPQTTQEPDATASKEIGEPLVQNNSEEEAWQDVTKKWGATHKIEKVYGTEVTLDNLEDNQSVCYGGKGFYFLLTKLNKSNQ